MLAVFHIALPFNLVVPTTEAEFRLYPAEVDGYEVTVDVPRRSGRPLSPESPDYIEAAYLANVLTIRFRRLTFDRRVDANIDPPANTINSVLGSFLERLKFVTQAPQVHPIVFPSMQLPPAVPRG